MNIAIFEDAGWRDLLPLTWTRAAFELRCGIDSLLAKIHTHVGRDIHAFLVRPEMQAVLSERFETRPPDPEAPWLLINARTFVQGDFEAPRVGHGWHVNGTAAVVALSRDEYLKLEPATLLDDARLDEWKNGLQLDHAPQHLDLFTYPWEFALANEEELQRQCTEGGTLEGEVYDGAHLVNPDGIHVGPGAKIKPGVVLDAEKGPIHIAAGAHVQPGAVVEGPTFIGRDSIIRAQASIRAGTSIGEVCKVGGEIESSIVHSYSNKQHDGFLGHSYVGQWVNLGADTVTSDLKNTYGSIRVSLNGVGTETGKHFVGAMIGDHAKTGIGTILPTGCIIGVAANVFTQHGVPKFVPSFAWLTDDGMVNSRVEKVIHIARTVMARRDVHLSDCEQALLQQIAASAKQVESSGWA